jgi:hypothetical protein
MPLEAQGVKSQRLEQVGPLRAVVISAGEDLGCCTRGSWSSLRPGGLEARHVARQSG